MSRSGFFRQGPAPTTISFRRIEHPTLAYVIKGHRGAIETTHAENFRRFGFVLAPNGMWYIPASALGSDRKAVGEARGYLGKHYVNQ